MSLMIEQTANRLRAAMIAAAQQVDDAKGTLSPWGGNPLDAQLHLLQPAWTTTPRSGVRRDLEDDLREAGARILAGFWAVEDACDEAVHREPPEVAVDDWRASFSAGWMPI